MNRIFECGSIHWFKVATLSESIDVWFRDSGGIEAPTLSDSNRSLILLMSATFDLDLRFEIFRVCILAFY